jgi:hypothetical protein
VGHGRDTLARLIDWPSDHTCSPERDHLATRGAGRTRH